MCGAFCRWPTLLVPLHPPQIFSSAPVNSTETVCIALKPLHIALSPQSGWSNLQDPDLNQMTSVSGARERPPAAKKMKQCGPTSVELKPDVKGTFHPSGPKFLNVWLWKHYKLSPRANCDKWALCALCLSSTWLFQLPVRPLREYSHS